MLSNIAGASANEEVSTARIASLVKVCFVNPFDKRMVSEWIS
jgi:hypothetical protein